MSILDEPRTKSKKKVGRPKLPTADRHKPTTMIRVRPRLAEVGKVLAERLDSDFTKLVNDALREKLERAGVWPLPENLPAAQGSRRRRNR